MSAAVNHSKGSDNFEDDFATFDELESRPEDLEECHHICYHCNETDTNDIVSCGDVRREMEFDEDIKNAIESLENGEKLDSMWKADGHTMQVIDDLLTRDGKIIVPITLRNQILGIAHSAHSGVDSMIRLIKDYVWWPNLKNDVIELVTNCEQCIVIKGKPTPAPMKSVKHPDGPYHRVLLTCGSQKISM